MDVGQLVAIAAAIGGLLVGLVSLLTVRAQQRKLKAEVERLTAAGDKDEADAAKILGETAVLLLEPAKRQIAELQSRLSLVTDHANELDAQLRVANTRVTTLESRVSALTDRLKLAQGLLTERGVPFPPLHDED